MAMRIISAVIALGLVPTWLSGQQPPILDVHLHALRAVDQGPPPLAVCVPTTAYPAVESGATWGQTFLAANKNPTCPDPIWSPTTDEELMERTLAIMERRNVFGVTSGLRLPQWRARAPDRIIPGLVVMFNGGPTSVSVDSLRVRFTDGRIRSSPRSPPNTEGSSPAIPP